MNLITNLFSSYFEDFKDGGVASSKSRTKVLRNTRDKMYKPSRNQHVFSNLLPYKQIKEVKIKNTPSSSYVKVENSQVDDLLHQFEKIKVKSPSDLKFSKQKIKKSPSPRNIDDTGEMDSFMKMFESIKIKPDKKLSSKKSTKKANTKRSSTSKKPKMDIDISDDDFLTGLMMKSMRISNKKKKVPQMTSQPLRRSSRTVRKPDRYDPSSTQIKKKQEKRSPIKLSPIVEERIKKQRKK